MPLPRLILSFAFILLIGPLAIAAHAGTIAPNYTAGVSAGNSASYQVVKAVYQSNTLPEDQSVKDFNATISVTSTVQKVSSDQRNVTGTDYWIFSNATQYRTDNFFVDLLTGDGNATGRFIAANLTAGELIYDNTLPVTPTINSSRPMTFNGATRQVNNYNFTSSSSFGPYYSYARVNAFWDQTSGILDQLVIFLNVYEPGPTGTITIYENVDVVLVETNIWTPSPNFYMIAIPPTLFFSSGSTATPQITVYGLFGFTGSVTLTPSVNSTSLTATCDTLAPISMSPPYQSTNCHLASSTVGHYNVTVTGTSGVLTHSVSIIATVSAAPNFSLTTNTTSITMLASDTKVIMITATSQNGFTGTINLSTNVSPSTGLTCTLSSNTIDLTTGTTGTSNLTCSGVYWSYLVTIKGESGTLTNLAPTIPVIVQDFTLSESSSTISAIAGTAGTATITVNPQDGYTGAVNLGTTIDKSGLTCNLSSLSLAYGQSTISCSGNAGTYDVTVKGTSGTLTHSVAITVTVTPAPDFSVSTNTTSVTMLASDTRTIMITATSRNGFTGTVNLSISITPSTGLTCTLSSNTIDLTTSTTGTSELSCSGVYWSYTLTVTGQSGSLTNQTPSVSVRVQDFTLKRSAPTFSMNSGASGTAIVTVSPQDSYTGTVNLATSIDKTGLTCNLSTTSLASGDSTLSCSGNPGTYIVTVTATSGSLTHTTQYTVTVTSPQQTPSQPASTILGLAPLLFYSVVGIVIAVIATAFVVLLRARRKPTS